VLTVADLHWRLLHAVPSAWLSRFVVRGSLPGPFSPDLIERIRERMNAGRFLWSTCVPIDESHWRRRRLAHPFRASAERVESEVCVHAVDADFGTLKVVWIGMSNDASVVLYEVFFPSLATIVLAGIALALVGLLVTTWSLALAIPFLLAASVSFSRTRNEIARSVMVR